MNGHNNCTQAPQLDGDTYPDLIRVTCVCGLDYFVAKRGAK